MASISKIGLIDLESECRKDTPMKKWGSYHSTSYPNLALMKISAYYKAKGVQVEWYSSFSHYDIVYVSKVFSWTPDFPYAINANQVYYGGTGFNIKVWQGKEIWMPSKTESFIDSLPSEIEHIMPDYTLYQGFEGTAMGFLRRGCPRGCPFCHVSAKEGYQSVKVAELSEWWSGQSSILLLDPNILACRDHVDLLSQLADSKAIVDITQGLDARLLNETNIEVLNSIRLKTIHFAWDMYEAKDRVLKGLSLFVKRYRKKILKGHLLQVFVLCNFNTTLWEDLYRIYCLRDLGYTPYVMVYNKQKADKVYLQLQRWVNNRAIFYTCRTFKEYLEK